MKPVLRLGLDILIAAAFTAVWVVSAGMARNERRSRTCQGKGALEVTVLDSAQRRFVAKADVQEWLQKEYGAYAGLPLDSVDLHRIETIISSHSAVRNCEAWITDNGVLHVQLSQRQPVLRLENGQNACYADETGYMFPLQSRGSVDVPVVSGKLPVTLERGYKGFASKPEEALWLERMINLGEFMKGKVWEKDIEKMEVNADGDLVLYPVKGSEKFIFGAPVRIKEKFGLMTAYYRSVVPSLSEGQSYTRVDIRHRSQIVCK